MVEFNKLYVLPNSLGLYIDCSVMDMSYFDDVYIDKIIIDTLNTFNASGPSDYPIYSYTVSGDQKSVQMTISTLDLLVPSMNGVMFFVYVVTKGTPSSDTPCGLDNTYILGVAVDTLTVYREALNYLHDLYNSCSIHKELIDFILRYRAFQLCLKTRNFGLAIKYWNKFIKSISGKPCKTCSCHG